MLLSEGGCDSHNSRLQRGHYLILATGATVEEHLKSLETILNRLMMAGLHIKQNKCELMSSSVTYLGHKIDSDGLHPLLNKIRAIVEAPCPSNTKQLKSFLGLLTYYTKFLPNLSSFVFPLNQLLQKVSTGNGKMGNKKH